MNELVQQLLTLQRSVLHSCQQMGLADLEKTAEALRAKSVAPDFWNDTVSAQQLSRQLAKLDARIQPWQSLRQQVGDACELAGMHDESLQQDLQTTLRLLTHEYEQLKQQLRFSGKYDEYDALVSIYAGAGGTDAQDWAEMLMRMYVRWAEQHNYIAAIIEQSAGDEAGVKSVTMEISGSLVYGQLQGEHGVHRLVRLSPFNADNLRQTSFAKVDVVPKIDSPNEVAIDEKDLKIDVYRAGGHGGQSVNTTDSAVRVTHVPTGITVAIQNERSQLQNRETALTILRSKLARLQVEQHKETLADIKGPNEQAAWGNQIRNYVLHPYTMVKDTRTKFETSDADRVLDGKIDDFIQAYLEYSVTSD